MRTGTIIEAMEAAKKGAKARPLVGDVMMLWHVYDGHCRALVPERKVDRKVRNLLDVDILGPWEIDDQPRRWPGIKEAVKHMQETGDWGRPVSWECVWLCVDGCLVVAASGCEERIGMAPHLCGSDVVCEWETKPAEDK